MPESGLRIAHLFELPQQRDTVAALIHHAFWTQVPGASVQRMAARLAEAAAPDRLPLCRVALVDGAAIGVVNLVDSDDDEHHEWTPWLAGLVVAEGWRGRGIGSALVRDVLAHARRFALPVVHFGTDNPGFYERLGAVQQLQPRPDFWFMRFELEAGS